MENIWQFSKVYRTVPRSVQKYSRYNPRVIWNHSAETHVDASGNPTPEYWKWREAGMAAPDAIRYPVGFNHRHQCVGAILQDDPGKVEYPLLGYVDSRRAIYLPVYARLLEHHPMFLRLQSRLMAGENLMIVEVDGPHQESLGYYETKYNVSSDFIQESSVEVTERSMRILLNDPVHPFGHGYCLAMALMGRADTWNKSMTDPDEDDADDSADDANDEGGVDGTIPSAAPDISLLAGVDPDEIFGLLD